MEYALILARETPRPQPVICEVLVEESGLHQSEALDRLRTGGGILAEGPVSALEVASQRLAAAGVETAIVEKALLQSVPHPLKIHALELCPETVHASVLGRRELVIRRRDIRALGLHGLVPQTTPADDGPRKRKRRGRRSAPLLPPGVTGPALSPRGRKLLDSMGAAELGRMELYLTLYPTAPLRPVRIEKGTFRFACREEQKQPHSLDNFLLLAEDLLAYLPAVWNREALEQFLESLDPRLIASSREEQVTNFDRWMIHWVRSAYPPLEAWPPTPAVPPADEAAAARREAGSREPHHP